MKFSRDRLVVRFLPTSFDNTESIDASNSQAFVSSAISHDVFSKSILYCFLQSTVSSFATINLFLLSVSEIFRTLIVL